MDGFNTQNERFGDASPGAHLLLAYHSRESFATKWGRFGIFKYPFRVVYFLLERIKRKNGMKKFFLSSGFLSFSFFKTLTAKSSII